MYRVRMMYRVRITLLVLALLPVLVGLGFWQLDRYSTKKTMEEQYQMRRNGLFTMADLQQTSDPLYFQLSLTGRFDNERSFLLDNRTRQGQVGFHVFTPFSVVSGETVLIDRGWIAGIADRSRLPVVPAVEGLVTVVGQSWKPAGDAFLLADDIWSREWPKVIQAIDQQKMSDVLGASTVPWFLIQNSDQPGSLQHNFHLTNMPATRHFGYAMQWFAMSVALVLLGGWALMKDMRHKNKNNNAVMAVIKEKQL